RWIQDVVFQWSPTASCEPIVELLNGIRRGVAFLQLVRDGVASRDVGTGCTRQDHQAVSKRLVVPSCSLCTDRARERDDRDQHARGTNYYRSGGTHVHSSPDMKPQLTAEMFPTSLNETVGVRVDAKNSDGACHACALIVHCVLALIQT